MALKEVFVQNLRKYRRNRGISQMKLAEMCGTSTSYIGQIEIGNRFPSLDLIERIAKALQIGPHLLFFNESDGYINEKIINDKPE
jgi:transcriptional regulator with XRE-family HTH domain